VGVNRILLPSPSPSPTRGEGDDGLFSVQSQCKKIDHTTLTLSLPLRGGGGSQVGFDIIAPTEHASIDVLHIFETFMLKIETGLVGTKT